MGREPIKMGIAKYIGKKLIMLIQMCIRDSYKIIGGILLVVLPLILIAFFLITQTDLEIIDSYQKERIMTFLDPENEEYSESAIQQNNSITAIGSRCV